MTNKQRLRKTIEMIHEHSKDEENIVFLTGKMLDDEQFMNDLLKMLTMISIIMPSFIDLLNLSVDMTATRVILDILNKRIEEGK